MSQKDIGLLDNFLFTLDWLLAVTRRYATQVRFSLIHINFTNPRTLGDTYGAQEAAHKLDDVLHCLSQTFRKTDLVARDGVDLWVVAPYTATDEKFADKIREIIEVASQNDLAVVERDISIFSLPFDSHEVDPNCSAAEFLAYLKQNHIRLASSEISLPPVE